jgi:two-component system response regulator AtoC
VDCTVLTEALFEAEVFGHARGAFTGSVGERVGMYEQANGGTLFLDEVGELPLSQQAKLLRVLEFGQYRRVGGRRYRQADVRIICATNRHLWDHVKTGQFREDLYYRIACMAVRLPPLRERLDDIQVLAASLLEPIGDSMQQRFNLTPAAVRRLKLYDYPGNVRELRNILFIAATHSRQGKIDAATVDELLRQHKKSMVQHEGVVTEEKQQAIVNPPVKEDESTLYDEERQYIIGLLSQHNNNRRQVAAALNVCERTLYRKLKKYHLN